MPPLCPEKRESRPRPSSPLPDEQALRVGLRSVFVKNGVPGGPVTIRHRTPNEYGSTFPTEVVTCCLADGSQRRLLCKYTSGRRHSDHGHRGGPVYEAKVYERVLRDLPLSLPKSYGAFTSSKVGGTWLVLDYLEDTLQLDEAPLSALVAAASWCGHFHALNQKKVRSGRFAFLTRYDADYYIAWSRRTLRRASPVLSRYPWLRTIGQRYEERVERLIGQPQTVIHGEYTPHNVVWRKRRVVPIDWESAAVGVGEIDLAFLVAGWDDITVRAAERSYGQARWPRGVSSSFQEVLDMARLYVLFRWLAADSDWTRPGRRLPWRLGELRKVAQRLGLL